MGNKLNIHEILYVFVCFDKTAFKSFKSTRTREKIDNSKTAIEILAKFDSCDIKYTDRY